MMRNNVFHIENQADALAYRHAIVECHATRLVYVNLQGGAPPTGHFGVNQLNSFARGNTLDNLDDARLELHFQTPSNSFRMKLRRDKAIKKVGASPPRR